MEYPSNILVNSIFRSVLSIQHGGHLAIVRQLTPEWFRKASIEEIIHQAERVCKVHPGLKCWEYNNTLHFDMPLSLEYNLKGQIEAVKHLFPGCKLKTHIRGSKSHVRLIRPAVNWVSDKRFKVSDEKGFIVIRCVGEK